MAKHKMTLHNWDIPMNRLKQYVSLKAVQITMKCWASKGEVASKASVMPHDSVIHLHRDDVIRAYKQYAILVHPDKNLAPGSDEAFKKLTKAKDDILSTIR